MTINYCECLIALYGRTNLLESDKCKNSKITKEDFFEIKKFQQISTDTSQEIIEKIVNLTNRILNDTFEVPKTTLGLENLTKYPLKRYFYLRESYFRQAHSVFEKLCDISFFQKFTFIVIRPDAIRAGAIQKIMQCMEKNGFDPVMYSSFEFNRYTINAFWQQESNSWPIERLKSMEVLLTQSESLFVILKRKEQQKENACDFLRNIKGPSDLLLRKPGQIRYDIHAKTGILDFLHFPDEPADIIREMGILFSQDEIKNILKDSLKVTIPSDIKQKLSALCKQDSLDIFDDNKKAIQNITTFFEKHSQLEMEKAKQWIEEKNWQKILKRIQKITENNNEAKIDWDNWNLIIFISMCNKANHVGTKSMYDADCLLLNQTKKIS